MEPVEPSEPLEPVEPCALEPAEHPEPLETAEPLEPLGPAEYVLVPNLAHFGNHFLPITAHFGMPILELIQNWHKQPPCSIG